jgi:hypothetical protein
MRHGTLITVAPKQSGRCRERSGDMRDATVPEVDEMIDG